MNSFVINTDVLVIGSGGAGCSAALEASANGSNVHIITQSDFLDSKTSRAQGGIQAALSKNDSAQAHIEDTLKAGEYNNDEKLVHILANEAPNVINWLEEKGVGFDKEEGRYRVQTAAGLSHPRILSCGDKSGNKLMEPLKNAVLNTDIKVMEFHHPTNITKLKAGEFITTVNNNHNEPYSIRSKTIVLACGGYVPPAKRVGIQPKSTTAPDIYDILNDIGLQVMLPDLIQYHPTGIVSPKSMRRKRVPETVRSAGATILNRNLESFCDPMSTRNKLTQKIVLECNMGNGITTDDGRIGVWLNTPIIDKINGNGFLENHFPTLFKEFINQGINISEEMILVYPILHYSLGGIPINTNTETNISGIFAAGEATYGVHGSDRLMGNSLLDIFVFGRIAGINASKEAFKYE